MPAIIQDFPQFPHLLLSLPAGFPGGTRKLYRFGADYLKSRYKPKVYRFTPG
jgi:hypothetical protein